METVQGLKVDEAFDAFYRGYRMYVHGLCRKRMQQVHDVCELESIVWFDIFQHFSKYSEGDPRLLLYRLVSWRANDLYHKRRREHDAKEAFRVEDEALVQWIHPDISKESGADIELIVREVLQCESSHDRELLFGRFVEGLTWAELASRHALHRNTLQKRINSSIKRLQAKLQSLLR